jgi:hypothetical protein
MLGRHLLIGIVVTVLTCGTAAIAMLRHLPM